MSGRGSATSATRPAHGATAMWSSRTGRTRWAGPSRRLSGPPAQSRSPLRPGRRSTPPGITTPSSGGETGSSTASRGSTAARSSPPSRLWSPTSSARESGVIPSWWSATGSSPSLRSPGTHNTGATTSLPATKTGISTSSGSYCPNAYPATPTARRRLGAPSTTMRPRWSSSRSAANGATAPAPCTSAGRA